MSGAPTTATPAAAGPTPALAPTASPSPSAVATSTPLSTAPPTAATTTTPSPSATSVLVAATAVEPGARRALVPGGEAVVHPSSSFEVELSVRAPDARLVLLDARADQVASASARELSSSRTRLTLAPSAALVPGSRYALRLDGASDRDLHDDAGRAYSAVTLPLLAAGSPPPPEPKKPERKRRRR